MAIDNLEIAKQLKKLQEELNDLVDVQTKSLKSQLDLTKQLADALGQIITNSAGTTENAQKMQEALGEAAENAEKIGSKGTAARFAESLKKAHKEGEGLTTSLKKAVKTMPGFTAFAGIWSGFTAGITGTVNSLRLFSSSILDALEGLGQLAVAVFTFPFRILNILTDFASQGGGDSGLRQALEDIRKEFGDLRKTSAKAIIDISRSMKGELANTGLSVWRTFGNLADRLKTIAEYAKNMGNVFQGVMREFAAHGEVLAAFIKGLHLTEEGQKAVATRAYATGTSMRELTREIANYSVQLGDEFGISAAQISQDMGDMMADFRNFGTLAPEILANISVYARRLGVDVKGLLGVIDQFDNFEDAARSSAQLTQAFGLQLDALQLLKAEDPAERTEMIRKAFFTAGRSIENMTRQERALLAQQTGLEDSALDLVFSAKNQGLSYDTVKKKSEAARKSQLTQAEALQKVAGAIERLVKSGSLGGGGFFERFFQGFERGILRSREFREIMVNIRQALRETYLAGIRVGQMFVDLFPGIRQLFKGLSGLFDRSRFREMTRNLRNIFREFFTSLTSTSGRDSFKNLMERLKTMFWNYFNASSPAGRNILDGVRKFSKAAAVIAAGLIREIGNGLTQGIRFITDVISGRRELGGGAAAGGAFAFIMELFEPIVEAIKEAWPPLFEALKNLWTEEVWPRIRDFLYDNALVIAGVLFGPTLLRSIAGGIGGAFAGALTKGLTQGATTGISEFASNDSIRGALSKGISSVFSKGAGGASAAAITETGAAAAAANAAPVNPASNARMAMVAGVMAIGMVAIVLGIWAIATAMKENNISTEQMLVAAGVMGVAGLVMIELAAAVGIISAAGATIAATGPGFIAGMVGLGLIAGAMGIGLPMIIGALSEFSPEQLVKASIAMAAGGAFFALAAGVLLAAAGVGAFLLTGVGLVGVVAGLAAINETTKGMVENVREIINEVSSLIIPGDFDRKFDIFSEALTAITSFGDIVARISESTSFGSLAGWITGGNAEDQISVLRELNNFIQNMGTHMIVLVRNILEQVTSLEATPEAIQRAEIFGTIMETLGNLMTALQGPSEVLSAGGGILSSIIGSNVAENLSNYSIFIENMGISLGNLLRDVAGVLTGPLSSLDGSEESFKGLGVITETLGTLGTLGRNMITVITSNFSHLTGGDFTARIAEVSDAIGTMIAGIFEGGGGGLIGSISGLMTELINSLGDISETDANRLTTVAPVLTKAFEAISGIGITIGEVSSLASSLPAEARGTALGTINAIIENMLTGIADLSASLLGSIREVFGGMTRAEASSLKTGVETFKSMIEAISTLPGALQSLYSLVSEDTGGDYTRIRQRLGTMISLFYETDEPGNPGLPELFRRMATAFNGIPEITGNPAEKLEELSKSLGSLNEISSVSFTDIEAQISENLKALESGAFLHVGDNIRAMVERVNSIATDLGSIEPINLNTSLKALAGRLGLGDSEELTIRNRDFNIEVNVEVHIDAQELERVLVERPNSRIMATGGRGGT